MIGIMDDTLEAFVDAVEEGKGNLFSIVRARLGDVFILTAQRYLKAKEANRTDIAYLEEETLQGLRTGEYISKYSVGFYVPLGSSDPADKKSATLEMLKSLREDLFGNDYRKGLAVARVLELRLNENPEYLVEGDVRFSDEEIEMLVARYPHHLNMLKSDRPLWGRSDSVDEEFQP